MLKKSFLVFFRYLRQLGIDPVRAYYSLRGLPGFIRDYVHVKRQIAEQGGGFSLGRPYPCLEDRYRDSGRASGHYFHQDLLVAQKIYEDNPERHVDIGSRVDGFVAHVASFRSIEVIDIRPLQSNTENIKYRQLDLMDSLPLEFEELTDSLSCLHALEHFGLGRYGDPINVNGHTIGFDNLVRMLRPGGKLHFSVPIGPQRIEFNAHRVFSIAYLSEMFSGRFRIDCFSFVDDSGNLHKDILFDEYAKATNCGCEYGCGIFQLTKRGNDSSQGQLIAG